VPCEEVPSSSSQNDLCMGPIRESVIANTDYYCLPASWLRGWQAYAQGRSSSLPTMIDMTHLIDKITPDMVLVKKELSPGQDYEIIPATVWKRFVRWYGEEHFRGFNFFLIFSTFKLGKKKDGKKKKEKKFFVFLLLISSLPYSSSITPCYNYIFLPSIIYNMISNPLFIVFFHWMLFFFMFYFFKNNPFQS
jgi:hypothetical protein